MISQSFTGRGLNAPGAAARYLLRFVQLVCYLFFFVLRNSLSLLKRTYKGLHDAVGVSCDRSAGSLLPGNYLVGCEVIEVSWIGRVVTRSLGIGIIVEHGMQTEVVEIRKRKAWTSVKESVSRKIVEVDPVVGIVRISKVLEAHVDVIDKVRVVHPNEIGVVAKGRAVSELEIVPVVAQRDLARKEGGMHDGWCQGT
jgi:hypothetical protein